MSEGEYQKQSSARAAITAFRCSRGHQYWIDGAHIEHLPCPMCDGKEIEYALWKSRIIKALDDYAAMLENNSTTHSVLRKMKQLIDTAT